MGCNQTRTFSTDMDSSDHPISEEDLVKPSVICMAHSPKALVVCLHPNKPLLGVGLEDGRILAINFETGDLDVNEYVAEDPGKRKNYIPREFNFLFKFSIFIPNRAISKKFAFRTWIKLRLFMKAYFSVSSKKTYI